MSQQLSQATERLYQSAQEAFQTWRRGSGLRWPVRPDGVADYLRHVQKQRGPSVVPLHLAAIGHLYRDAGKPWDTKHDAIRRVMKRVWKELGQ